MNSDEKRSQAAKLNWQSPSIRARYLQAFSTAWTPEKRKALGKTMREVWRRRKARAAQEQADASQG